MTTSKGFQRLSLSAFSKKDLRDASWTKKHQRPNYGASPGATVARNVSNAIHRKISISRVEA
jgi:hypothetical protein